MGVSETTSTTSEKTENGERKANMTAEKTSKLLTCANESCDAQFTMELYRDDDKPRLCRDCQRHCLVCRADLPPHTKRLSVDGKNDGEVFVTHPHPDKYEKLQLAPRHRHLERPLRELCLKLSVGALCPKCGRQLRQALGRENNWLCVTLKRSKSYQQRGGQDKALAELFGDRAAKGSGEADDSASE